MDKLNKWLRNNFGFSKTESNGFVLLLPLMLVIVLFPAILKNFQLKEEQAFSESSSADSLLSVLKERITYKEEQNKKKAYWYAERQGSKEEKASNQQTNSKRTSYKLKKNKTNKPEKGDYKKPVLAPFDINTADTVILKKIYGIGPVLSARIVKYRDLLGGFTHKAQLKEVYGLEGDALHKLDSICFVSEKFTPKKLTVNSLKSYELDDHPYVSRKLAKAIDAYRFQHGSIDSVGTLYQLQVSDSTTIQKIYPYLTF